MGECMRDGEHTCGHFMNEKCEIGVVVVGVDYMRSADWHQGIKRPYKDGR